MKKKKMKCDSAAPNGRRLAYYPYKREQIKNNK